MLSKLPLNMALQGYEINMKFKKSFHTILILHEVCVLIIGCHTSSMLSQRTWSVLVWENLPYVDSSML